MSTIFRNCLIWSSFFLIAIAQAGADRDGPDESAACSPLSEAMKRRLVTYLQENKGLSSAMCLRVDEIGHNDKCYRQLRFSSTTYGQPFEQTFYLSPDQKFLSPELYELDVSHKEQDRRQSAVVQARLEEASGPALGTKNGAVTLVIFSDFQCPYCKQAAEVLRSIAASDDGGQIRVEFRHHPLRSHSWARKASRLAACAGRMDGTGAFWDVHDFLFAQQDSLTSETVEDKVLAFVASRQKLDINAFQQCIQSSQPDEVLLRDENIANGLNVTGTPTMFINGSKQVGVPNADSLRILIDQYARAKAPGGSPQD